MNIFKVSLPRFMMLFVINITLQRDVNVLLFNFADGNELSMLSRSYCTWCKCDENIRLVLFNFADGNDKKYLSS